MNPYRLGLSTLSLALVSALAHGAPATDSATKLVRQPTVSADQLAFVYAGDIWIAQRDGSNPRRLTAHPASEFQPRFSPDGRWIAFSASYDNNTDVYVMPASGGQPQRLTWHPGADTVSGWSTDGKRVLFASAREVANGRSEHLYEVPYTGGPETKLMAALATEGVWSADGKRLAYRPFRKAHNAGAGWRQSRGGTTPPIWIIDPATQKLEKLPHVNASDFNPLWAGDEVVFISDRNDGAANLYAWHSGTKALRQLTRETVWDVRHASVQGRTVVYEVGGEFKQIDLDTGSISALPISLAAQAPQARPQWKDASKAITQAQLSPTGKRVLMTARGDVFSVPVKDGSVRNLSKTDGVREANALWRHDGQKVAYLSDEGRVHSVMVRGADGLDTPVRHALPAPGYYELLSWSPDGQRILFHDNQLRLFALKLDTGAISEIDQRERRGGFAPAFSPDGQWLAYTVEGENHFTRVKLYHFASGRKAELANHLVETDNPVFSSDGLLYFTASTNAGPAQVRLDMSTQERPVRKGIYAAVLAADGISPLAPKTGDEEAPKADKSSDKSTDKASDKPADKGDAKAGDKAKPAKATKVDLDGLADRIVALPVAERNYDSLTAAADGALFYLARKQPGSSIEPDNNARGANADLYRYNREERSEKLLKSGVSDLSASLDGKKLLISAGEGKFEVADAGEKLDGKPVDVSGLRMLVDPRREWAQIFDETWRMQRDFFYDPKLHGLDWQAVRARYAALLPHVPRREDLNELLADMIGELQVAHNNVRGGDVHTERPASVGLLGADFALKNGRYVVSKIYRGDRWNPFLPAPLAAAGVGIAEGDTLLAVNGRTLDGGTNLFAALEDTVGKQVTLSYSRDGKTTKTATVVPVASEAALRQWDWVERNREYVDRKSGGKLAYVYMPDTADAGYTFFNRLFFAQRDRAGLIVDDRRNGGGQAANYVLELLSRPYLAGWKDRSGLTFHTPAAGIWGPKAMLIDQDAGSGGDFMPYGFKRLGLGKLIGTRTWGGLIGISANPDLIDGGNLTVPFFRFYTPEGEWRIENEGVAPDIEVDLDPVGVNAGKDSQLDAAIDHLMQQLPTAKPVIRKEAPPYPTQVGK
ncbi:S41 family peptidase [Chitinimonas sp. BJYL2]|uniref:S41 family peptidase n=1 Tax=Chitinimonas sp. BJYL2 TaxID=2976696 RepID=UPI0022B39433|nr:S41 family peptidase [Chitinimonas sp. BJYL2]